MRTNMVIDDKLKDVLRATVSKPSAKLWNLAYAPCCSRGSKKIFATFAAG